ncbi:aquaporin family protein [Blattabacterium sp. DPU]|uniref:MIP/aquaporin family protein n=1 Tax=Blattabacterium sp. DPU TaxID=2715232 RepID=UPI0014081431|nr:MIP/aquaporin family protein [Blattabacterium sp. DPU]QIK16805.1 aquaporin family protein [Blattabacterium sp. DPU]
MKEIYAEIIGTMILVFLGNSVIANIILPKTKGHNKNGEWLTITIGWALAVFMGITVAAPYSGAHLNPCVTISFAIIGKFNWKMVPIYIFSQFIGAMLGAILVWFLYKDFFLENQEEQKKLSIFATIPSGKNSFSNFLSEVLATFIFIFISLYLSTEGTLFLKKEKYPIGLGSLGALPSALVVLGIVLSLGGVTGAALNPARDLGPRIIHSIIPIPGKGTSNWNYALIPILGPIVGCVVAATLYLFLSS